MGRKITVSVLMATYNGEKYLREQIESLIAQKDVNIKILVRDDGSSDETINILEEYKLNGLLSWYQGEHLNVQKGFLDLLKKSPDSDYYAFCDQDDVWDDDKLYVAVNRLKDYPRNKPSVYYCGQRLVDENLKLLSIHRVSNRRNAYTNFLISNNAGCTTVFNKTLRDIINQHTPEFILMHDSWVLKLCIAVGGSFIADPEPHISYRQHRNNTIGLNTGIKSLAWRVRHYIVDFKIQRQIESLLQFYEIQMTDDYVKFAKQITQYNKSIINWIRLLFNKKIDFDSRALNFIVFIKILLCKL